MDKKSEILAQSKALFNAYAPSVLTAGIGLCATNDIHRRKLSALAQAYATLEEAQKWSRWRKRLYRIHYRFHAIYFNIHNFLCNLRKGV